MPIFQSLAGELKKLAVGDRVKVTLRPETGRFPNPMEGEVAQKDEAGNLAVKAPDGIVRISAEDILSISKMPR